MVASKFTTTPSPIEVVEKVNAVIDDISELGTSSNSGMFQDMSWFEDVPLADMPRTPGMIAIHFNGWADAQAYFFNLQEVYDWYDYPPSYVQLIFTNIPANKAVFMTSEGSGERGTREQVDYWDNINSNITYTGLERPLLKLPAFDPYLGVTLTILSTDFWDNITLRFYWGEQI